MSSCVLLAEDLVQDNLRDLIWILLERGTPNFTLIRFYVSERDLEVLIVVLVNGHRTVERVFFASLLRCILWRSMSIWIIFRIRRTTRLLSRPINYFRIIPTTILDTRAFTFVVVFYDFVSIAIFEIFVNKRSLRRRPVIGANIQSKGHDWRVLVVWKHHSLLKLLLLWLLIFIVLNVQVVFL